MENNREIDGYWWIPGSNERWPGTLALQPGKSPSLRVMLQRNWHGIKEPAAIHGHDQSGRPITLLFPGISRHYGGDALRHLVFVGGYAVLGYHCSDHSAFEIDELDFRMQHLYEWCGLSGFINQDSNGKTMNIGYTLPKDVGFQLNSELTLQIKPSCSYQAELRQKKIEENVQIGFKSSRPLRLEDTFNLIDGFRSLLHFAVLDRVFPLQILTTKKDCNTKIGDYTIPDEIEVWNSLIREPVESEKWPDRWVFQFKDVQSNFDKFFSAWLSLSEKFEEALDCYFSTVYHSLPDSMQHLCLTQALDAYHGVKYNSHEQFDFKVKVRQLTECHKTQLSGLIDNVDKFVEAVHHNRNWYTHHNPKWIQKGGVVSNSELYRLNEKIRLLFQMCILDEAGIPADRFNRLRRQIASKVIDYNLS